MQKRPLLILAALAAASEPDFGRGALERIKTGFRDRYKDDPMGTSASTVLVASWLFYKAEAGRNPKVTSFYHALEYVTTSLNVGYSDILPKTAAGKSIAAVLMTVGPAMATGILDEPGERKQDEENTRAVIDRLDRILAALEARNAAAPAPAE